MRLAVVFAILVVLYCVAADDAQKKSKEKGDKEKPEESSSNSTTSTPPRPRRSPPRFDANQMKGKYAKSSKMKGVVQGFDIEDKHRQERSIVDYLSPTPALLYAAKPPVDKRPPPPDEPFSP